MSPYSSIYLPDGTKLAAVTKYYKNSSNGLTAKVIKNDILNFPQARIGEVHTQLDKMLEVMNVIKEQKFTGAKDLFFNSILFLSSIEDDNNKFELEVFLNNFKKPNKVLRNFSGFDNYLQYVIKVHNIGGKRRYSIKSAKKIMDMKLKYDRKFVNDQILETRKNEDQPSVYLEEI